MGHFNVNFGHTSFEGSLGGRGLGAMDEPVSWTFQAWMSNVPTALLLHPNTNYNLSCYTRRIKYGLWDANHTCGTASVELSIVVVEPGTGRGRGRGLGAGAGAGTSPSILLPGDSR
jgi:hypothetical protein